MERKQIISEAAKSGILPGLVLGGVLGLAGSLLFPGGGDGFNRVFWLFPVGAIIGGMLGAVVAGLVADHRNPP